MPTSSEMWTWGRWTGPGSGPETRDHPRSGREPGTEDRSRPGGVHPKGRDAARASQRTTPLLSRFWRAFGGSVLGHTGSGISKRLKTGRKSGGRTTTTSDPIAVWAVHHLPTSGLVATSYPAQGGSKSNPTSGLASGTPSRLKDARGSLVSLRGGGMVLWLSSLFLALHML